MDRRCCYPFALGGFAFLFLLLAGTQARVTLNDGQAHNDSATSCHCNPLGSRSTDCANGQCECKRNVEGAECDRCRYSTFGLSQNNPDGCRECFCSGVINQCHESSLYVQQIPVFIYDNQHGFTLTDAARHPQVTENFELDFVANKIGYRYADSRKQLFWSLPSIFTGNKVKSYGGKLTYTQQILTSPHAQCGKDQDVILFGNGITLYWTNPDDVSPNSNLNLNVPLTETQWLYVSTNGSHYATRTEFMSVLANIDAILVRASLCDDMTASYISDFTMDTAGETATGFARANQVEACRCPPGYTGTSCETCAPGYYRNVNDRSVSPLGTCAPCPCDGQEQSCELDYSGQVKCNRQPQFDGGFRQKRADDVTVRPAPIVVKIDQPKILILKIGENLRFHCSGKSLYNKPVTMTWMKEGGELPPGRVTEDSYGLLDIKELKISDSGNYICLVTDGMYFKTEKVTVHVEDPFNEPSIEISPSSLVIVEGQPAEFVCRASVPANIEWERTDGRLNPNATVVNGILRIPVVALEDAANYKCIVSTRSGLNDKTAMLLVRRKSTSEKDSTERTKTTSVQTNPRHDVPLVIIEPQRQKVPQGMNAVVTCNTDGGDDSNFVWTFNSNANLPQNVQATGGTLRINNIQMANQGYYTCKYSQADRGNYEATAIVDIEPREMPLLQVLPDRPQAVLEGSTAEFHCRPIKGIPAPEIKWSRLDQRPLSPNVQVLAGGMMRISNVSEYDKGAYTCVAQNVVGTTSATVTLEVNSYPKITVSPQNGVTRLRKGERLHLGCSATGHPMPSVDLRKMEKTVIEDPNVPRTISWAVKMDVNSVTSADEGTYVCTAINSVGKAEKYVEVRLEDEVNEVDAHLTEEPQGDEPPKVADKLEIEQVGGKVTMRCQVVPYADDKSIFLEWKREDGTPLPPTHTITNGTLFISDLNKKDSGNYTCIGTDAHGRQLFSTKTRLNVVEPPKIRLEPLRQTLRPGENPSIHCIVTGDQPLNIEWEAVGRPLSETVRQQNGLLRFSGITYSDAGKYACKAWNDFGTAEVVAEVSVEAIGTPYVKVDASKNPVSVGDSVELRCVISGIVDPRYVWSKLFEISLPSNTRESGNILTITDVQSSDAGLYRCAIDAEGGAVEGDFTLH